MATFKNGLSVNIGTSDTSVLTGTAVTTIIGLTVANITSAMVTVDVMLTSGATTAYIVKGAPVMPGGSLIAVGGDQKVVLEINDILKVKSSAASSVDVICSYLEV
jgi:hypothetical protein